MISDFVFTVSMLVSAILTLWFLTGFIIQKRKIILFLPFFFSVIVLCFSAGFTFYGIFEQRIWFVLESSWALIFFWIFVNLREEKWK